LASALKHLGVNMAGMDFFIRPATGTGSADWVRIPNADIDVKITRRLTRTIIRGGEGDNLHDEGAESTIYTVRGILSVDDYKKILKMFRTGQPFIHDPFEERDVKVIFATLGYEGSTEKFLFELIEDVI
ncbi:MAG: hypothetical protein QGG62_00740, partial [Candidatus Poseidoniaceae archaeon]|nr:hypothetical protein [Candidatus Poseidoniaceae archaeon]